MSTYSDVEDAIERTSYGSVPRHGRGDAGQLDDRNDTDHDDRDSVLTTARTLRKMQGMLLLRLKDMGYDTSARDGRGPDHIARVDYDPAILRGIFSPEYLRKLDQ